MASILARLTAVGLRRLAKFIVKRSLGPFLGQELLLEQVQVDATNGNVIISDVTLSPSALSESLATAGVAVDVVALRVERLEARLSYAALTDEGLRFSAQGLHIEIKKKDAAPSPTPSSGEVPSDSIGAEQSKPNTGTSADDPEGVRFIAHWIELLVASLRVNVYGIDIKYHLTDKFCVELQLEKVEFYNTHPQMMRGETSMSLSQKSLRESVTGSMSTIAMLGKRKLVELGKAEVTLHKREKGSQIINRITLLRLDVGFSVQYRQGETQSDLEFSIPQMNLDLDLSDLMTLFEAVSCLSDTKNKAANKSQSGFSAPNSALVKLMSADPKLGNMFWLHELRVNEARRKAASAAIAVADDPNANENDEINYNQLIDQMQQIQESRASLSSFYSLKFGTTSTTSLSSSTYPNTNSLTEFTDSNFVADDDIDFPSDEDGNNESEESMEFFDAQGGNSKNSKRMTSSQYGANSLESSSYQSTYSRSAALAKAEDDMESDTVLRTQVHIIKSSIVIRSKMNTTNQLLLVLENLVLTSVPGVSTNSVKSSKISLSINSIGLFENTSMDASALTLDISEAYWEAAKPDSRLLSWITLHSNENKNSTNIIHSPQVQVDFETKDIQANPMTGVKQSSESSLAVTLEPLIFSVHIRNIEAWSGYIAAVMAFMPSDDSSKSDMAVQVSVTEVDVFIHTDTRVKASYFEEMHAALELEAFPDRWTTTKLSVRSKNPFKPHLQPARTRGGVHIQAKDLNVLILSNNNSLNSQFPNNFNSSYYKKNTRKETKNNTGQNITATELTASIFTCDNFSQQSSSSQHVLYRQSVFFSAICDPSSSSSRISLKRGMKNETKEVEKSGFVVIQDDSDEEVLDNDEGRVLYSDSGALSPPNVNSENILRVEAFRTIIDIKKREYCALMAIATALAPPSHILDEAYANNTNNTSNSKASESSPKSDQNSDGFGILLFSQLSTIRISDNSNEYNHMVKSSPLLSRSWVDGTPNGIKDIFESEPFSLCMAVSEPLIKVFSRQQQVFFSIQADDISMFEMTASQCDDLAQGYIAGSSRSIRTGDRAYCVPFLHRTTLHNKSGRWDLRFDDENGNDGNKTADNLEKFLGDDHTFKMQLLLDEQAPSYDSEAVNKTVSINMSLQDVTIRYDASSKWLLKVVDLFTPMTPTQLLNYRKSMNKLWEKYQLSASESNKGKQDADQQVSVDKSNISVNGESDNVTSNNTTQTTNSRTDTDIETEAAKKKNPFEVTKVSVRLRKCIIDYCCEAVSSRLLFSVGLLSVGTTVLSNTPRFSLKFTVRDISLLISNRLEYNPWFEQSPLDPFAVRSRVWLDSEYASNLEGNRSAHGHRSMATTSGNMYSKVTQSDHSFRQSLLVDDWIDYDLFLDVHGFVQILNVDYMEVLVTLDDTDSPKVPGGSEQGNVTLDLSLGLCSCYGCFDSLEVLAKTLLQWWQEIKIMTDNYQDLAKDLETLQRASDMSASMENADTLGSSGTDSESKWIEDGPMSIVSYSDRYNASEKSLPVKKVGLLATNKNSDKSNGISKVAPVVEIDKKLMPSGWLNRIQNNAFAPVVTSQGNKGLPENNNMSQGNKGIDMNNYLIDTYYGGHQQQEEVNNSIAKPVEDSIPEFETRWLPQYDDEESSVVFEEQSVHQLKASQAMTASQAPRSLSSSVSSTYSKQSDYINPKNRHNELQELTGSVDETSSGIINLDDVLHDSHIQIDKSLNLSQSQSFHIRDRTQEKLNKFHERLGEMELVDDSMFDESLVDGSVKGAMASHEGQDSDNEDAFNFEDSIVIKGNNPTLRANLLKKCTVEELELLQSLEEEEEEEIDPNAAMMASFFGLKAFSNWNSNNSNNKKDGYNGQSKEVKDPNEVELNDMYSGSNRDLIEKIDGRFDISSDNDMTARKSAMPMIPSDDDDFNKHFDHYGSTDASHNAFLVSHDTVQFRAAGSQIYQPHEKTDDLDHHEAILHNQRIISSEGNYDGGYDDRNDGDSDDGAPLSGLRGSRIIVRQDDDDDMDFDHEKAWSARVNTKEQSRLRSEHANNENNDNDDFEERSQWFIDPNEVKVEPHYVPTPSANDEDDGIPEQEKKMRVATNLKIKASLRMKLFSGKDWPDAMDHSSKSMQSKQQYQQVNAKSTVPRKEATGGRAELFANKNDINYDNINSNVHLKSLLSNDSAPVSTESKPIKSSLKKSSMGKSTTISGDNMNRSVKFSEHNTTKNNDSNNYRNTSQSSSSGFNLEDHIIDYYGSAPSMQTPTPAATTATMPANHKPNNSSNVRVFEKVLWKRPAQRLRTRINDDIIDIHAQEVKLSLRVYDVNDVNRLNANNGNSNGNNGNNGNGDTNLNSNRISFAPPAQRVTLITRDLILSYRNKAMKRSKKVLGCWKSHQFNKTHVHNTGNLISMSFVGYHTNSDTKMRMNSGTQNVADDMEHRVHINISPLQCHLDKAFIDLVLKIVAQNSQQNGTNDSNITKSVDEEPPKKSDMYFQMITINKIDIKIDYESSSINLDALKNGDYLQFLNLFPIEALEITLKKVQFAAVSGMGQLCEYALQAWIHDIYSHQLHRVLSGSAALRGVSNIVAGVNDLIFMPMKDYTQSKGLMRDLQRKSANLVKTVTTETLHMSYKLTTMVAKGISDLAEETKPIPSTTLPSYAISSDLSTIHHPTSTSSSSGGSAGLRNRKQPKGLSDGLVSAYESISRETGQAAECIIAVPVREYRKTGSGTGLVRNVLRALPVAILKPVSGAAEGASMLFLGLRNSLDPERQMDEEDRWDVEG